MSSQRRPVLLNRGSKEDINGSYNRHRPAKAESQALDRFHGSFPGGGPTRLVRLDGLASALGLKAVFVKDESTRFGLPSFKILGASWGTFRAVAKRLGIPLEKADIASLKDGLTRQPVTLYAASEGNHGRAVAHMARLLGASSEIHVPATMHAATIANIESEGARVIVNKGTYDDAMDTAKEQAGRRKGGHGLLVQDYSFADYTEIPQVCFCCFENVVCEVLRVNSGSLMDT